MMRFRNYAALSAFVVALGSWSLGAAADEGDAAKGEKVFIKCKTCHSLKAGENKIGPTLHGIVGRKAGTVEGFKYSDAMANAGIEWTDENLHKYLEDPKGFIPKNKMIFPGLKKDDDRDNVIAYLKKAD